MRIAIQNNTSSDGKNLLTFYVLGFFLGLSISLMAYVTSTYFKEAWNTENVSVFYILPQVGGFALLLYLHVLIARFGRAASLLFLLVAQMILLALLGGMGVSVHGSFLIMAYLFLAPIVVAAYDILLEAFSTDSASGRIRGIYLTVMNAGFVVAPILSTRIVEARGFGTLFYVMFGCYAVMFLLSLARLRHVSMASDDPQTSPLHVFRAIAKNKDISLVYMLAVTLEIFFIIMVIYTPLYLQNIGLTLTQIGLVFSVMLVPYVLLEYPAGRIADTKLGEKEIMLFALAALAVSTMLIPFVHTTSLAIWMAILVTTRVGASLLEVMRDSYFYKRVDGSDVNIIAFFRTARPVGVILGSAISFFFLFFTDNNVAALFLLLAGICVIALYPALKLKDSIPRNS